MTETTRSSQGFNPVGWLFGAVVVALLGAAGFVNATADPASGLIWEPVGPILFSIPAPAATAVAATPTPVPLPTSAPAIEAAAGSPVSRDLVLPDSFLPAPWQATYEEQVPTQQAHEWDMAPCPVLEDLFESPYATLIKHWESPVGEVTQTLIYTSDWPTARQLMRRTAAGIPSDCDGGEGWPTQVNPLDLDVGSGGIDDEEPVAFELRILDTRSIVVVAQADHVVVTLRLALAPFSEGEEGWMDDTAFAAAAEDMLAHLERRHEPTPTPQPTPIAKYENQLPEVADLPGLQWWSTLSTGAGLTPVNRMYSMRDEARCRGLFLAFAEDFVAHRIYGSPDASQHVMIAVGASPAAAELFAEEFGGMFSGGCDELTLQGIEWSQATRQPLDPDGPDTLAQMDVNGYLGVDLVESFTVTFGVSGGRVVVLKSTVPTQPRELERQLADDEQMVRNLLEVLRSGY